MTKTASYVLFAFLPQAALAAGFGDLPLRFEVNRGQADGSIQFLARGPGYSLGLTSEGARFITGGHVVTMRLAGANTDSRAEGEQRLAAESNYMVGTDRSAWRTGIANYGRVRFAGVYRGVDLVYYGNTANQLEYDFVVGPGADATQILFRFEGSGAAKVDPNGDLVLSTPSGEVRHKRPVIYQDTPQAGRREIAGSFRDAGEGLLGFRIEGAYDRSLPLVIDPVLQFSTFFGGQIRENASAIALDPSGNIYVAGLSASADFPRTAGAFSPRLVGGDDVFIAKLNPTGSAVLFATQVGGSEDESGISLAVDRNGNAYIGGSTRSINFPTTTGSWRERGTGVAPDADGFLFKLGTNGNTLVYSTRVGAKGADTVNAVAVDGNGAAYVTGQTSSSDYPVTSEDVVQSVRKGFDDAFVTKFSENGSSLVWSTLLGGDSDSFIVGTEAGRVIAVDRIGSVYVAGITTLRDFPITPNAIQDTHLGQSDVFFTKIQPDGKKILYSTFLGGEGLDTVQGIYIEPSGTNVYLVGGTTSARYPTTRNALQTFSNGGQPVARDGFVTKINASGQMVYSTFFGGNGDDQVNGIVADDAGNAYVIGTTSSTDLATTIDALQKNVAGDATREPYDAFVAYLDPLGSRTTWATYLGGPRNEEGNAITRDSRGNLFVAGYTQSSGFPLTPNALQRTTGFGTNTAFIARIGDQRASASQLVIVSGNQQRGNQGTALPQQLVVELRDEFNVPIINQRVEFAANTGLVTPAVVFTDNQGRARAGVTLPDRPGTMIVTATAASIPAVRFELTSLRVGPPLPEISSGGVVSAGLSTPALRVLATNSIATVFGDRFAPAGTNVIAGPDNFIQGKVPTNLAGICVTVDGVAARILAVTEKQINFIVPELTRVGTVPVQVLTDCGRVAELKSDPQEIEVRNNAPEFFYASAIPGGRSLVSAVDAATGRALTAARPGQVISIYGTGFGPTNPPVGTGELAPGIANTVEPPIVSFDGRPLDAANILYAGVTPGLAGVYQLNLIVPLNARNGNIPVLLRFGLQSSPPGSFLRIEGGENRDPQVSVSPSRLEFGDVLIGQTRELPITIANSGTSVLTIRAFDTGLSIFTLRPNFGFELDPGETRVLTMSFRPNAAGPVSAILRIASDDPVDPVLNVNLTGNAFVQPPPPNPVPVITNLVPNSISAGGAAFNLVVNGTNFIRGSVVRVNGRPRSTFFNNAVQLIAFVEAGDIIDPGSLIVTVFNPEPAGGASNPVSLPIRGVAVSGQPLGLINQMDLRFCPAVTSFVSVLDSGGLPVRNLTTPQLTCKDGDQIVDCTLQQAGGETPVALHLLFGMNGIENETEQVLLKSSARQIIQSLGQRDRIAITHLEDANRLQLDFSSDPNQALNVINSLRPVPPGNALYDSVVSTATSTQKQTGYRKIVLLITALDNLSGVLRDLNQALGTARSSGVTFYTVAIGKGQQDTALTGFLRTLARDTGGQYFAESEPTNYSALMSRIATIIQSQYEVRHQAVNFNGVARELEFTFRIPEGTVKAVRNYSPCLP